MGDVSISDSTISTSVVVKKDGYDAKIVLGSDSFNTPDWSKMNVVCRKATCIYYIKYCQKDAAAPECVYYFSQPGDSQNVEVKITYKQQEDIQQAEKDIGVLAKPGGEEHEVLLSAFTKISDSPAPPLCGRGVPERACWPSRKTPHPQTSR
jgi:hypothetical protein